MPCYHPIQVNSFDSCNEQGEFKRRHHFLKYGKVGSHQLPCGKCKGCRLQNSRIWGIRCYHEAQMYDENCFVTLTYAKNFLPDDRSIHVEVVQSFLKRLREKFGEGIRVYYCGEYGSKNWRPHYHLILFNFDFQDKYLWEIKNGQRYYRSDSLEKLWEFGNSVIGNVTYESAAYVARYCMKKINGKMAEKHYERLDPDTGIYNILKPEFAHCSLRGGSIGYSWIKKYLSDVYPHDYVVYDGIKFKPPRYYDKVLKVVNKDLYDEVKVKRALRAVEYSDDNTLERLAVKEKCLESRLKNLVRSLEDD